MAFSGRPHGLANLGNTCYLNSLLQCLNAVGLADVMGARDADAREPLADHGAQARTNVFRALVSTLKALSVQRQAKVLRPQTFVDALQRNADALGMPDFAGWGQNDVAELYSLLGDCIHEATKTEARVRVSVTDESRMTPIDKCCLEKLTSYLTTQHSIAAKSLAGLEVGVVTTTEGEYISAKPEIYYVLAVPVPTEASTVEDCVKAFSANSMLTGNNQFRMPDGAANAGTLVDAVQRHIIWLAPQFLVVEARLYKPQAPTLRAVHIPKGHERLQASSTLSLPIWSSGEADSVRYGLCGVAYHRGGSREGGHYTAVVRNRAGQKWNCNDTSVSELPKGSGWPAGGYCFFYRKIL